MKRIILAAAALTLLESGVQAAPAASPNSDIRLASYILVPNCMPGPPRICFPPILRPSPFTKGVMKG